MQAPGGGLKSAVSGTQFSQLESGWLAYIRTGCVVVVFYLRKRTGLYGRSSLFYKSPSWRIPAWFGLCRDIRG